MVEIREIVGVEQLHSFYNENPEQVHIVLYDNFDNTLMGNVYENFKNLSENHIDGSLLGIANMGKAENAPLIDERRLMFFPFIEFTMNNLSYYRHLGDMEEYDFYTIIDEIKDGIYEGGE